MSKFNKLNIVIVGCGKHAKEFHIPSFLRLKKYFKIVGVYDPVNQRAKKIKKLLKNIKIYKNFKDILFDNSIDTIDICSPPRFHFNQIVLSMEANKNVMVEKPMVLKTKELKQIIKINKKYKKTILCLQQQIYREETKKLITLIRNKNLVGKLKKIEGIAFVKVPAQINNSFTDKFISGGGPVIDQGSHIIGLIIHLFSRRKIKLISGNIFYERREKNKKLIFNVETRAFLKFKVSENIFFDFETAYHKKNINFSIKFYFTKGLLHWPSLKFENYEKKNKMKVFNLKKRLASDTQFLDYFRKVKLKRSNLSNLNKNLKLVNLIEKSYHKSKKIKLY